MNKQKGFTQLLILFLVVLAVTGVLVYHYMVVKKGVSNTSGTTAVAPQYQQTYSQAAESIPTVNNSKDLNNVSTQLDAADTTQIDSQLNQLDNASSF